MRFAARWAARGSGWLGRSAYGLAPTPASTHSLSALEMLCISLSGPSNRRIQPGRYAKFFVHPRNLDMTEQPEIAQEKTAQIRYAAILGGATAIKNMLSIVSENFTLLVG